MTITVGHEISATNQTSFGQTLVSGSFTPTANSKCYVWAIAENNNHATAKAWGISNTGGLSFSVVENPPDRSWAGDANFATEAILWVADVGGSPSAMTVTVDPYSGTQGAYISFDVFCVSSDATLAVVQTKSASEQDTGGGSESITVTMDSSLTNGNTVVALIAATNDTDGAFSVPTGFSNTLVNLGSRSTKVAAFWDIDITGTTVTCSDLGEAVGASAIAVLEFNDTVPALVVADAVHEHTVEPVTLTQVGPHKVADRGSVANTSAESSTAVDMAAAGSIAVGNYLIARLALDNSGASGAATTVTVTDPRSNTWTVGAAANQDPGAAAAGISGRIAYCKVVNAYTNGDDITFNYGNSTTAKAIVVEEWTGIDTTTPVEVAQTTTNGASGTPSIARQPLAVGSLFYGCLAVECGIADSYTEDADTTEGLWGSLTRTGAGTTTSGATVAGAAKVVTGTGAQTWNPTITSRDWAQVALVFAKLSTTADLVVADSFHGHTADAVTLTQVHVLTVADAFHGHTADAVALSQSHVLAGLADSAHEHTVDNVALTQQSNLVVADGQHEHTVDNVTLTQVHVLAVDDSAHEHTVDNIALTQVHELAGLADSVHEHTVDAVVLNVSVNLAVDDTTHEHTVEAVTLTQAHNLTVSDASHEHTVENVDLTQVHTLAGMADCFHEHTSENVTLAAGGALEVDDAFHGHTVENTTLTQAHTLTVADAAHGHTSDNVALTQDHTLAGLADSFHGHTVDNVTLSQELTLTVADSFHGHTVDAAGTLEQFHNLTVSDTLHGHTVEALLLTQVHILVVDDAFHGHTVDGVSFLGDPTLLRVLYVPRERRVLRVPPAPTASIPAESRVLEVAQ